MVGRPGSSGVAGRAPTPGALFLLLFSDFFFPLNEKHAEVHENKSETTAPQPQTKPHTTENRGARLGRVFAKGGRNRVGLAAAALRKCRWHNFDREGLYEMKESETIAGLWL